MIFIGFLVKFTRILFLPKGAGKNKILTLLEVKILTLGKVKKFLPLRLRRAGKNFINLPAGKNFFYLQAGKNFILPLPLGQEQYIRENTILTKYIDFTEFLSENKLQLFHSV